jgi:hypothetical protein
MGLSDINFLVKKANGEDSQQMIDPEELILEEKWLEQKQEIRGEIESKVRSYGVGQDFRSPEFEIVFEFLRKVMSVLEYSPEHQEDVLNQVSFGIQAYALEMLLRSLDYEGSQKFAIFLKEDAKPEEISDSMVAELMDYIQKNIPQVEISRTYLISTANVVDAYMADIEKDVTEDQRAQIDKIIEEQKQNILNLQVGFKAKVDDNVSTSN